MTALEGKLKDKGPCKVVIQEHFLQTDDPLLLRASNYKRNSYIEGVKECHIFSLYFGLYY